MANCALVRTYDEETTLASSIRFSPDGRYLAYARADVTVVLAHNPFVRGQMGDVNADGCVDNADLLAVLLAFGTSGSCLTEDANGDGVVDDTDLLIVLFQFGSGC